MWVPSIHAAKNGQFNYNTKILERQKWTILLGVSHHWWVKLPPERPPQKVCFKRWLLNLMADSLIKNSTLMRIS